jgi:hypothetical protein
LALKPFKAGLRVGPTTKGTGRLNRQIKPETQPFTRQMVVVKGVFKYYFFLLTFYYWH